MTDHAVWPDNYLCRKCGEREDLNSDGVCFTCWGDLTPWWKSLLWALRHPRWARG